VLLISSLISFVIPDVPFALQKQMHEETYQTNNMIINTELDRARGHTGTVNLDESVTLNSPAAENVDRTDYVASFMNDMELCALTSGSHNT